MKFLINIVIILIGIDSMALSSELSYSDITEKLYDLCSLAKPPAVSESSGNFSSYDRNARYDSITGKYQNWYSNDDGSGYIRKEEDGIVAAEMTGPGVIWRIWSAQPESGLIKFYIDDQKEPVLAIPFKDYFDNSKEPFNYSELVRDNARGKNSYIPITYDKSCKIVLCNGWGRYYQISYSSLPSGTKLSSFSGRFDNSQKSALSKANQIWSQRKLPQFSISNNDNISTVKVNAGDTVEITQYNAPAAITAIKIKIPELTSENAGAILRQLAISINWDGNEKPAVWSPLGDFFGSGPGVNPYNSLTSGMNGDEFYCYWYMPFNSAKICLSNDGDRSCKVLYSIETEEIASASADNLLRFHAKWHRDSYLPYDRQRYMSDRWPDWPVLYVENTTGRFCGMALHLWNPLHMWDRESAVKYKWNFPDSHSFLAGTVMHDFFKNDVIARTYWWGEGDEKFFVDNETMPSTFGTGTEDYFGYAWGTPAVYGSAVQCQTRNIGNTGHISMCRWQIADNIPFQNSFEGCIEKYHDNNWPLQYAVTAYWYQHQDSDDSYEKTDLDERLGYEVWPELR